jgi:hypothetical protein
VVVSSFSGDALMAGTPVMSGISVHTVGIAGTPFVTTDSP